MRVYLTYKTNYNVANVGMEDSLVRIHFIWLFLNSGHLGSVGRVWERHFHSLFLGDKLVESLQMATLI